MMLIALITNGETKFSDDNVSETRGEIMAGISRKLKREEGFHARIFTTKELAEMYIKRAMKK